MGMLDIFKNASVETGGLRDQYLRYLEYCAEKGIKPLPFPEFAKLIQQQQPPMGGIYMPK